MRRYLVERIWKYSAYIYRPEPIMQSKILGRSFSGNNYRNYRIFLSIILKLSDSHKNVIPNHSHCQRYHIYMCSKLFLSYSNSYISDAKFSF